MRPSDTCVTKRVLKLKSGHVTSVLFSLLFLAELQSVGGSLPSISEKAFRNAIAARDAKTLEGLKDDGDKFSGFVLKLDAHYGQFVRKLQQDAPDCLSAQEGLPSFQLSDGSKRRTWAISADGKTESKPYPECLAQIMPTLSMHYDLIEKDVVQFVEVILGRNLTYKSSESKETINLEDGPHKDHVHVYSRQKLGVKSGQHGGHHGMTSETDMVPYHVDNGIFLLVQ